MNADQIRMLLGLRLLEREGGYFAEVYRSDETLDASALPQRYGTSRSLSTAIYYLLAPETFSAMHRLRSDEVFHFYLGDPVELLLLAPERGGRVLTLGADLERGMRPQAVVPRGAWQGLRLAPGGSYALLGTTVAPGFAYEDFELGDRAALVAHYPEFRDRIVALTR